MSEREPPHEPGRNDLVLLAILSSLAGLVDVLGLLRLGHIFTAHITGNLVVLAADIASGGPPHIAQVLSIPVFMLSVACAFALVVRRAASRGRTAVLAGQALLLVVVLGLAIRVQDSGSTSAGQQLLAAMVAVAAMAFQNVFVRLSLQQSSTTSVMTGNVATATIALLALVRPGPWPRDQAVRNLRRTAPVVLGFFVGCAMGAAASNRFGAWAWALPASLSLIAVPLGVRTSASAVGAPVTP